MWRRNTAGARKRRSDKNFEKCENVKPFDNMGRFYVFVLLYFQTRFFVVEKKTTFLWKTEKCA